MANAYSFREYGQFTGTHEKVEMEYDFTHDGGAQGVLNLLQVSQKMIVMGGHLKVISSCTSGGAAELSLGVTGDSDAILQATAVADLTADTVLSIDATAMNKFLDIDDMFTMTIASDTFTAGKFKLVLFLTKF